MSQPENMPPFVSVLQMLCGLWVSSAVSALARIGVPDQLESGPKAPAELAAATGVQEEPLYRLMRATASLGVLTEQIDGRFAQTPLSDVLRTHAQPSLRNMAMMYCDPWHMECWTQLPWSVETGRPAPYKVSGMAPWDMLASRPAEAVNFNNAMTDMSQNDAPVVAGSYNFSQFETLVDVGGGIGTLLAHILLTAPRLHGTLFDIPSVADAARQSPILAPFANRCAIIAGSFLESVPPGASAYALKHILHDWDDDSCVAILKNIHKNMARPAKVLVIDRIVGPGNAPDFAKLMDLEMLAMVGGKERTRTQWNALFERGGFRIQEIVALPTGQSILEGVPV